jgi:hypothetical protein
VVRSRTESVGNIKLENNRGREGIDKGAKRAGMLCMADDSLIHIGVCDLADGLDGGWATKSGAGGRLQSFQRSFVSALLVKIGRRSVVLAGGKGSRSKETEGCIGFIQDDRLDCSDHRLNSRSKDSGTKGRTGSFHARSSGRMACSELETSCLRSRNWLGETVPSVCESSREEIPNLHPKVEV